MRPLNSFSFFGWVIFIDIYPPRCHYRKDFKSLNHFKRNTSIKCVWWKYHFLKTKQRRKPKLFHIFINIFYVRPNRKQVDLTSASPISWGVGGILHFMTSLEFVTVHWWERVHEKSQWHFGNDKHNLEPIGRNLGYHLKSRDTWTTLGGTWLQELLMA